ncbi:MAG: PD-(D/E)XK nuclease family protein [Clostridiales bacterium]|nr:PD-(D/E)XK nuclease family protein [Clostridiales bacterium]
MLHIIPGRTGSGKTRTVRKLIAENAKIKPGKSIILVPEQFTFETERAMLDLLGNEKINNVDVTSFTYLAEKLLKDNGKLPKKNIDDGVRSIIMSMAVETIGKDAPSFNRYTTNVSVIFDLVKFRNELKKCCISLDSLEDFADMDIEQVFNKKVDELVKIFKVYDAMVNENYGDDTDHLDILFDYLHESHYFKGKTVAIDAFSGFSKQEYRIVENIICDADDVYVTFCYDSKNSNGKYELFHNTKIEIDRLRNTAAVNGIKIDSQDTRIPDRKYKAEPLNFLEENLFSDSKDSFPDNADNIVLIPCQSKKDECDTVAAEIRRLVREDNYRYRDIAIIERDEGSYKNELLSSFRKYNINCFIDNRQPIDTQPVIVFLISLFRILIFGFRTEFVFQYIKTGLLGLSVEEIAELEDYTYMWNIRQSQWTSEWKENPYGFSDRDSMADEAAYKLGRINKLRRDIVIPIVRLKEKLKDKNGQEITAELFDFLKKQKIGANLKNIAEDLEKFGNEELSIEQGTIWKIVIDILDSLYYAIGEKQISLRRYCELFTMLISTRDVGMIPNAVDEVMLGSADRIRASAPRAVFIVGSNMGVFPNYSFGGLIFNDKERCKLINEGISLVNNMEYNCVNEMFIAYHALTLATDRLYMSYSLISNNSEKLYPSELIVRIEQLFPQCRRITEKDSLSLIESEASAFSAMAKESVNGKELYASLYDYFSNNGNRNYSEMIDKVRNRKYRIADASVARELFGRNMRISASKVEKYYECPFGYFCEYGLRAKPRKQARIDPALAGTILHHAMETVLRTNSKDSLVSLDEKAVKTLSDEIIDRYICEQMGGYEEKPQSFIRRIKLIKKTAFNVLLRLIYEFANCDFVPVDFELEIGKDVEMYKIPLDDGESICIKGKIDRVDKLVKDGKTYIRIVDYKSTGKKFELGKVFEGINMQMLIYLFALWENGKDKYDNIVPAGILYYPAVNPNGLVNNRNMTAEELRNSKKKSFQMKGMVINDPEIIEAMDHIGNRTLIEASIKDGLAVGNVISIENLMRLKDRVDDILRQMVNKLYDGDVDANPLVTVSSFPCDFCDYHDVCKHEESDEIKEVKVLGFDEAIDELEAETNEKLD